MPSLPGAVPKFIKSALGLRRADSLNFDRTHQQKHADIEAEFLQLVSMVGTGSSGSAPTANTVRRGTGTGTADWGQIANAHIANLAGILYSKLSLANSIVNADINASAAIALSKLAAGSAGFLKSNGTVITAGNTVSASDVTAGAFMIKLAETTLAGAASVVDFTNISQSYRSLVIDAVFVNSVAPANAFMRFSADGTTFDAGANYDWQYVSGSGAAVSAGEAFAQTSALAGHCGASGDTGGGARIHLPHYTFTTLNRSAIVDYLQKLGTSSGQLGRVCASGYWRNSSAIRGIRFLPAANNFANGTRITIWGIPV